MSRLISFLLALIASAVTAWFMVMALRHEFPDADRNTDAIKAIVSGVLALSLWAIFAASAGRPGQSPPPDDWRRDL